jgi:transcriptional regulator with PAS, ATPase and Fis domain
MEFERVGDSTPIKVDVRVVAATNRNLTELIAQGRFRQDLYYRLKVVQLDLPPLRDRREDIPLLSDHFLKRFNTRFAKKITAVSTDVQNIFMAHPWPGNVRELRHAMEHASLLCRSRTITADHLPGDLKELKSEKKGADYGHVIRQALEKTHWNKTAAARLLGMSRQNLYRKLKEFKVMDNDS